MCSVFRVYFLIAASLVVLPAVRCFSPPTTPSKVAGFSQLYLSTDDDDNKFSFGQRIESTKSGIVGLVAGSICLAPVSALHNIVFGGMYVKNGLAQWELDTDLGSLEAALFAIVYRYCIRQGDNNPQLNQGVLGAFVLTRTFSKIQAPFYCSAIPLDCGSPLGYFDWAMLGQGLCSGLESVALFGGAAAGMDYCFQKGWISKFP